MTPADEAVLLDAARRSIRRELERRSREDAGSARELDGRLAREIGLDRPVLREPGASFVTLRTSRDGRLRGCIGSLERERPLLLDVLRNARRAAFHDPRFPALDLEEFEAGVRLSIAVLGLPEPLPAGPDEAAFLQSLRPGVDGLVLMHAAGRATFLPSVWEQLPNPVDFVRQLKRKAGLPEDAWPAELSFERYETHAFEDAVSMKSD